MGLDPGLRHTGWGIIDVQGNRLQAVANGVVSTDGGRDLASRLAELYDGLATVIEQYRPDEAAVEIVFMNKNPVSTIKLGQARGVVLLAPAKAAIPVFEYAANLIKKSIVGVGHAEKDQVAAMIKRLLPTAEINGADAADALAVAICHAHHRPNAALRQAVARGAA